MDAIWARQSFVKEFGKEKWYKGCKIVLRSTGLALEVAVDPMCKNLAIRTLPEVWEGFSVVLDN